jgi:copper/silver efflux system protein
MTVVAIMAGLLPIMWSTGTGSEIMQRIAVPMIGGMISSTLLTLIVIPAIFGLVKGFGLSGNDRFDRKPPTSASKPIKRPHRDRNHVVTNLFVTNLRIPEPAE